MAYMNDNLRNGKTTGGQSASQCESIWVYGRMNHCWNHDADCCEHKDNLQKMQLNAVFSSKIQLDNGL